MADGKVDGVSLVGTITAGVGASGVQVFASALKRGKNLYTNWTSTVKAQTTQMFDSFFQMMGPFTDADEINYTSRPQKVDELSLTQLLVASEIAGLTAMVINNEGATVNDLKQISNWNQQMQQITIRPAIETTVFGTSALA